MFKKILRIKNYGIFKSYDWNTDPCPCEFEKRNIIYGWNYSGKTTLSRIFSSFEHGYMHPDFSSGEFEVVLSDNTRYRQNNLVNLPYSVRVFNSDFIDQNLEWKNGIKPILMLGEEGIELQKELDLLNKIYRERKNILNDINNKTKDINKILNKGATDKAGEIRKNLGVTPFNRTPHLEKYINIVIDNINNHLLSEDEYKKELSIINSEKRDNIDEINLISEVDIYKEKINTLFSKVAIREAILELKNNQLLESWVEKGIKINKGSEKCKFCGNTIPEDLFLNLEKHFTKAVDKLNSDINNLYNEFISKKIKIELFDESRLYIDLRPEYKNLKAVLNLFLEKYNEDIEKISKKIEEKYYRKDESYSLDEFIDQSIVTKLNDTISNINKIVCEHVTRNNKLAETKKNSLEKLILHNTAEYLIDSDYLSQKEKIHRINKLSEKLARNISQLKEKSTNIERQISEEVKGADRINELLKLYFGKDDISIELNNENKYSLIRANNQAKNLSEGEKTAISFSYFLAKLQDKDTDITNCIVYIDDPISSLDSNHLYNTFSMIKSCLKDAHQVFVSTHNYEFFKILKGDAIFKEYRNKNKVSSLYIIKRKAHDESEILDIPTTLKSYNSEYHYLFSLIYNFYINPNANEYIIYNLPNMLRKLLEIYTSFKVPKTTIKLNQRIDKIINDDIVSLRVYKFINHISHSDSLNFNYEFPQLDECQSIVSDVLTAIQSNDLEHYNGMVGLV